MTIPHCDGQNPKAPQTKNLASCMGRQLALYLTAAAAGVKKFEGSGQGVSEGRLRSHAVAYKWECWPVSGRTPFPMPPAPPVTWHGRGQQRHDPPLIMTLRAYRGSRMMEPGFLVVVTLELRFGDLVIDCLVRSADDCLPRFALPKPRIPAQSRHNRHSFQ